MYPVNAPWISFHTAVAVLDVLGQNKKLVWANFILFVFYFIEAISVHTIEEEVLWQTLFSVRVVSFCLRVISKAAQVQLFQPYIALDV